MAPKRKLGAPLAEKRGRKRTSRQSTKKVQKKKKESPKPIRRRKPVVRKAASPARKAIRKPAVRKPAVRKPTKPVRKVTRPAPARKPTPARKPALSRKLAPSRKPTPLRRPAAKPPAKPSGRKPHRVPPKAVRKPQKAIRPSPKLARKVPAVRKVPKPAPRGRAASELARAKAALAKARAELAKVRRATKKSPAKKPAHAPKRASRKLLRGGARRDERGRFVTYQRWRKERAIKRVEKEFAPLIETEGKQEKKRFGITKKGKARLDRKLVAIAKAVEDSNFDLQVELLPSILVDAVRWESAFAITGLPKDDPDMQRDMLTDALEAAMASFPKKKRGWMVSIGMLSDDLLFLMYARKRPIFENRFLRLDKPEEINLLTNKLRELLDSMEIGRFQVSGMRIQFYYDQHVAKLGYEKAMAKARAKKGVT